MDIRVANNNQYKHDAIRHNHSFGWAWAGGFLPLRISIGNHYTFYLSRHNILGWPADILRRYRVERNIGKTGNLYRFIPLPLRFYAQTWRY